MFSISVADSRGGRNRSPLSIDWMHLPSLQPLSPYALPIPNFWIRHCSRSLSSMEYDAFNVVIPADDGAQRVRSASDVSE